MTTSNDRGTYPSCLASHQLEYITLQGENLVNGMLDAVLNTKYLLNLTLMALFIKLNKAHNAKSPLLDGLSTATFPTTGV